MSGLLGFPFYVCLAFSWLLHGFIVMFFITFRFIIYIIIDDCICKVEVCVELDLKGAFALYAFSWFFISVMFRVFDLRLPIVLFSMWSFVGVFEFVLSKIGLGWFSS
jgi:hypothetical protein